MEGLNSHPHLNDDRAPHPAEQAPPVAAEGEGRFVEVGGRRVFYAERGHGRPLVLLHGWGQDHSSWAAVLELLSSRYRLIAVDLRGHGRSDVSGPGFSFAGLSDDVFALMQQLGIEGSAVLVGHSMGGMVVQQLAVDHPEAARAVVILDADLNGPRALRAAMTLIGHVGGLLMRGAARLVGETRSLRVYPLLMGLAAYSRTWRKGHPAQLRAEADRFVRANSVAGLASSFVAYASRPDLREALTRAAPRALLVRGSADLIMSQGKMAALCRAIPGSRLTVVPGAGHMTPSEQPEAVAALIDGFVLQTP
jgi:3-oxoadipate enol-lactonase